MKKFLRQFALKRVQGAFLFVLAFVLQQFGVAEGQQLAESALILIQAFGGIWGVYGIVDAYPGHDKPPA